jgi:hypothetical protein
MKLLFFAIFGMALAVTTIESTLNSHPPIPQLGECDLDDKILNKPVRYYPKKECNIDKSSVGDPKKLSIFITECMNSKDGWLLIRSPEANYIDEILHRTIQ